MDGIAFPRFEDRCPVCEAESTSVAYMIVGEPAMDEEMSRALDAGEIALAGCMPPIEDWRDSDDAWTCRECNSEWVTRRRRKTPLVYRTSGAFVDEA